MQTSPRSLLLISEHVALTKLAMEFEEIVNVRVLRRGFGSLAATWCAGFSAVLSIS